MNLELLHKPYRNKLRTIITTYPQIDGDNPLFDLCIELINTSHQSFINLEDLARELIDIIAVQKKKMSNDNKFTQLELIKQTTLNWLKDDSNQVKIPFELLNALASMKDPSLDLSEQQNLTIQLERIKKATVEHQHLLTHIYQTNQTLVAILDKYLINRKKIIQDDKIKEYKNNYLPFFQKSYQQKENTIEALKKAIEGNPVDLKRHLSTLRNGTLSKELKKFVISGQANVLVNNQEVHTVSDFIKALDAQINSVAVLPYKI